MRNKKNLKNIFIALTSLVLLTAMITAGGIFAKYRSGRDKEAEMNSHDFHVSSDYLEANSVTYTLKDWMGGIRINLFNYEKENTLSVSSSDVSYSVTLNSNDFVISVKDGENSENPNQSGFYTLKKKSEEKTTHTVTLIPKDPDTVRGTTLTVTITTTAPFKKVLTASFKLEGKSDYEYDVKRVTDNGDYYELTLYTNQFNGTVNFEWPSDLVPDNTNIIMRNWLDSNKGSYSEFKQMATYKMIFLNPEEKEYTKNDFKLSVPG